MNLTKWFKPSKLLLVVVIAVLLLTPLLLVNAVKESQNQTLNLDESLLLVVNKGESLSSLCRQLIKQNIITDCFGHKLWAKLDPTSSQLKSGTYKLNTDMTLAQLITTIATGKEAQFSFTILEGDNVYQVLDKLKTSEFINDDLSGKSLADISGLLEIPMAHPEGFLHPETYFYSAHTLASTLLSRAVTKQQAVLNRLWENRAEGLPIKTPYEALILASIIEKESSHAAERGVIASVFYNRLNKRMRLQTDPTVIYGIWHEYEGDIKRRHLNQKTAYNTYRINGLPPTPIANPSTASIKAVLHPELTDYLYFVASGKGDHVFSKTLAEHNKAVRAFLNKSNNS